MNEEIPVSGIPTVAAIIERDGLFLMQHHRKSNKFSVVSGKIEKDEVPFDAIFRELKEEINFEVHEHGNLVFVDTMVVPSTLDPSKHFHLYVFRTVGEIDLSNITNQEPDVCSGLVWLDKAAIQGLYDTDQLRVSSRAILENNRF